jgi:autotransporter-associated beta strand protein
VGDYQRDQGHSFWQVYQAAWAAEVLWKQGFDAYSLFDRRILATSEYYGRYNLPGPNPPFIIFGAPYDSALISTNAGGPRSSTQDRMVFNIAYGAYVTRLGLSAPWTTRYRDDQSETADSFVYRKSADASTATNKLTESFPPTASLTTGLTSADLNGATPTGSTRYTTTGGGTWTLASGFGGNDPWNTNGNDTVHFAYKQVTGDFTMIAQVTSVANVGSVSAKAGIMLRDALGTATNRFWIAITAATNVERVVIGWTNLPYGQNMAVKVVAVPQIRYWVKMERVGGRVQGFHSPNGADWTPSCVADMPTMPSTLEVGLFGSSQVTGTAGTATFANVRITGGDGAEAPKIPSAPFAIYAGPGDAQVPLRWNEAFNATGYNVKRSLTGGTGYTTIATVTNTIYTDTNVANGTTYYYVVTATNSAGESGNSMADSVSPQLTMVNVAVGGAATASADDATDGNGAAQAFDGNPGTKWINNYAGTNGWLQYDLGPFIRQTVQRYALTSAGDVPGRDPAAWQFLASNDGSTWTTLDTQTNQGFPYREQTLTYPLGNTNAYRFYRLNITANNGTNAIQLSELALLAIAGTGTNLGTSALVWSGAVNGAWDTSTANWQTNGVSVIYQNGDPVLFDDTVAGGTSISLAAPVLPSVVYLNNALKSYTFSGSAIAGATSVFKTGGGTITFNSANTFSNGLTISGGTVTVGNNAALGTGPITLGGGTLNNNAAVTLANNFHVIPATTTAIQAVNSVNWTISGNISGGGNLNQTANGYTAQVGLGGDDSGFTGTWTENQTGNGNVSLRFDSASAGSASAAWVFNDSQSQRTRFNFGTGTISFGSLSGSAGAYGLANISAAGTTATLSVGALNTSTTFAGVMEANGTAAIALTKVGTGTLALTGANAYTGLTTVSNGELIVSTVFAGKGNIVVANAATFGVTNLSGGSALVSNLTVAAGSALEFQNVASATLPLIAASNMTVNGSCTVRITGTNGLVAGSGYPLVSYAGTLSGSFANLQLQMPYGWRGVLANSGNKISLANVAVVSTVPPLMTCSNTGAQMQLSWPAANTGWRLQAQTNNLNSGLGTNWTDISATATNQASMPIGSTNGSVFFRLVYP